MDSQKRLLLALALSFAATMVYMMLFAPRAPTQTAGTDITAPPPDAGTRAAAPTEAPAAPAPAVQSMSLPAVEVRRDLPFVHYAWSSRGAGLTRAELQGPKMREQVQLAFGEGLTRLWGGKTPPAPQMDMGTPVPGQALPLAVSIQGAQPLSESANYRIEESDRQIRFVTTTEAWEVVKTLEGTSEGQEL